MEFYYYSLCHVCKEASPHLKKCSSCKALYYCSREHQLKDWHKHKSMCKVIAKTNKILSLPSDPTPDDVNRFKYSSALLWQVELRRQLHIFEHHMWMFPKICAVCYSREADLVCQVCMSVCYCSAEHQDSHRDFHERYCPGLKLSLIVYQTLHKDEIAKDYNIININAEAQTLPEDAVAMFRLMGFHSLHDFSKRHVDYLIMSEFYCPVITMIYALEKSRFVQNRRGRRSKLVVHIVGCDLAEYRMWWALILEFFAHWILNLKSTKIFLIGPEVDGEERLTLTFSCEECRARRYSGTLIQLRSYYHDLIRYIAKPDVVVAFNSGLHEFSNTDKDTWRRSIPKLIYYKGVPTILTAYNEAELLKDLARFPQQLIKFYVEPERNPYSNLRPIRNWEEGGNAIYYQNGYIAIITKKNPV